MAALIGSMYVTLTTNSRPFEAGMSRAANVTRSTASSIRRDVGLTQRSVSSLLGSAGDKSFRPGALLAVSKGFENASERSALFRSSLLSLTAIAGGLTAALGSNLIARYADTFINLNNQLRTVTDSSENLVAVQQSLEGVAERSRSSLQATATLYARTARATESFGLSQEKLLKITETVQKAFSIGGATSAEASGAAIQLSQGIASDRFSGEEFRSVAENAPVLLRGIAESLNVDIGTLREMAKAGELTAKTVTEAILGSADRIEREFGRTQLSVDRALGQVDNQLITYIGNADKAYGVSKLLTGAIIGFGSNLDAIIPTLTAAAGLIGSIFLSRNKGALGGGIGALLGGVVGTGLGGAGGGIIGSAIGGLAGFGAGAKGGDFLKSMKDDAAAAKQKVVDLTEAQKQLRQAVYDSGATLAKSRADASGDLALQASKKYLNEYKRQTNQLLTLQGKLASVTQNMSVKAAALSQEQINAENELRDKQRARYDLQKAIVQQTTRETAALGMQATSSNKLSVLTDAVKGRLAAQKALADNEQEIANKHIQIANREIAITNLTSDADKKAVGERLAIHREYNQMLDDRSKLVQQQGDQEIRVAEARKAAVADGAKVMKAELVQTTQAFKANKEELAKVTTNLTAATRATTLLGRAGTLARSAFSGLVGVLGGPAGIAITALVGVIGYFSIEAQKAKEKTESLKQEMINLGIAADNAGNAIGKSLQDLEMDQLKLKLADIREQIRKIGEQQGFFDKVFSYNKNSLGNIIEETNTALTQGSGRPGSIQLSVDDKQALNEINNLAQAVKDGSIDADTFSFRLRKIGELNLSKGVLDMVANLRQAATDLNNFRKFEADTQKQIDSKSGPDSGWIQQIIAQEKALKDQKNSMASLLAVKQQLASDASQTEEQQRLAEMTDKVMKAWQGINEEKGLSLTLSRRDAEIAAAEQITIEDAAAAQKIQDEQKVKSAAETLKLTQSLRDIQAELARTDVKLIDRDANERVKELVDDFVKGRRGADSVIDALNVIAGTTISGGMADLITKIQAAIPALAGLIALFSRLPGAKVGGPVAGEMTYGRGALGNERRRLQGMQDITDAYLVEQERLSNMTDEQADLQSKIADLMTNVPKGGTALTKDQATATALQIQANEKAAKLLSGSGGGGGGGGGSRSAFDKAISSLHDKTAAENLDTDALTQNAYASAKAKAMLDLENAAREDSIGLTPERVASIEKEADAYAKAAVAQEELKKKQAEAAANLAFYRQTFSSFFSEIASNLKEGQTLWDAFANAASSALDKIADRALDMAANGIFDMIFSAITGGIAGSAGSAVSAGVTAAAGNITGSIGGSGWMQSAAKHVAAPSNDNAIGSGLFAQSSTPVNDVGSAASSVTNAPNMSVVYSPTFHAPNADSAGMAALRQQVANDKANFEANVIKAVRKGNRTNTKF